jgi:glycosyltransferase involved in cell wall biosynthesis
MPPSGDVAVVIPARNESGHIEATVAGAAGLPGVDLVIVVDDGSADDTAARAGRAGATVLRHSRNRGKAAAMETGAEAVRLLEATDAPPGAHHARHLLFLDADLGETASAAGPLTEPVRTGEADMTIAVFTERVRQGGHGLVVGLSGAGIERATGTDWASQVHRARQFADVARALAVREPAARGFVARRSGRGPGRRRPGRS